jgi:hypothetical protein
MPFEHALWRIDGGLAKLPVAVLEREEALEDHIQSDVSILNDGWMIIGRQIRTDYGGFIDLLAIDRSGALIVIELKKSLTPRDVIAQSLDYASWVEALTPEAIASVFERYAATYASQFKEKSLDEAFKARFGIELPAEDLNNSHEIVVVAARLDASTERIVKYLAARSISINVVFFQVFADGDRKLLSRVWFIDPVEQPIESGRITSIGRGEWNGVYYVSFGADETQNWEDAVQYGFISAYGGTWYTKTLTQLNPGDRFFVNIPGRGYVGYGSVEQRVVRADEFKVTLPNGSTVPILQAPVKAISIDRFLDDTDKAGYLVGVRWIRTLPLAQAIHEIGFFGNQNTVCRPKTAMWNHTVERLSQLFGISPGDNLAMAAGK